MDQVPNFNFCHLGTLGAERLLEERPRSGDVALGRVHVADGDAQRVATAQHGVREEHLAAIVFVAQRGDVASVAPEDDIDPAFGQSLRAAARAGVLVLACALDMTPAAARAARRIPTLL